MTEQAEPFKLDISKPADEFTSHLKLEDNKRILFSGPFGTGKTYFLKEYFKYQPNVFHLYPVNYSVSTSEDIFELVKYDLLYLLLDPERELVFEKTEYSSSQQVFVKLNDPKNNKIVANILKLISSTGVPLSELYDLIPAIEDLLKREEGYDELKKIKEILVDAENKNGSIFEFNDTSKLIQNLLVQAKEKHGGNENILIIDDLDRIDPEHIFRLLNVFAAHFDINKDENKFGFDKVIFVCDIDNIRRFFSNRFGQDTDFSGYIDKFYSREVFAFDNRDMIMQKLDEIFGAYKLIDPTSNQRFRIDFKGLKFILLELIKANVINFRSLLKFTTKEYKPQVREILFPECNPVQNCQVDFLNTLEFLFALLGSKESFLGSLNKISKIISPNDLIGSLVMINSYSQHKFSEAKDKYSYQQNDKRYIFSVKIREFSDSGRPLLFYGDIEKVEILDPKMGFIDSYGNNFFELLYETGKTLVDIRILK